jgi:hypothetical protein
MEQIKTQIKKTARSMMDFFIKEAFLNTTMHYNVYLNIELVKKGFRLLYICEYAYILKNMRKFQSSKIKHIRISKGIIIFYTEQTKLIDDAHIGRLLGYICPSNNYEELPITLYYITKYKNEPVYLYCQKIPYPNEAIIARINDDTDRIQKILGYPTWPIIKF